MKTAKQSAMALAVVLSLVGVQAHAQSSPSYYGINNNIVTDDISFGTGYVTNGYGGVYPPMPAVPMSLIDTRMSMSFNNSAAAALNAVGVNLSPFGTLLMSTTRNTRQQVTSIDLKMAASEVLAGSQAVAAITAANEQITEVATKGGLTLASFDDGFTNTGGSLTLNNLTLDASGRHVLADVSSSEGSVASMSRVAIFDLVNLQSTPNELQAWTLGSTTANLVLSAQGTDLFFKGLGLMEVGKAALQSVGSFGSVSVNVGTVPEPSAWISMGLGMLGIGLLTRRRQGRQAV
jgi:PEP-CTERM motif